MIDIIARIKHKLAYLQQHDDGDVIDATSERKWQVEYNYPSALQDPHIDQEVTEFEAKHHIRLPEDYRQFLLHVGRSGAGPFYRFHSPISDMLPIDEIGRAKKVPMNGLDQPFPFTETISNTYELFEQSGWEQIDVEIPNGQIILGEYGCGCWHILIITGECRNQMWYKDDYLYTPIYIGSAHERKYFEPNPSEEFLFTPETRVTFTQWYEAWLNKQISIAQEHWRKRGRDVPPLALDDD